MMQLQVRTYQSTTLFQGPEWKYFSSDYKPSLDVAGEDAPIQSERFLTLLHVQSAKKATDKEPTSAGGAEKTKARCRAWLQLTVEAFTNTNSCTPQQLYTAQV